MAEEAGERAGGDDALVAAIRNASQLADDIAAKLARMRVAKQLFGAADPVCIGRYELERQVGAGGGGVVFVAWDPELSRRVALKLIATAGRRERVLAEGHALARLSHPNVVPIFDVGTLGDQIYLVMELVEGATLRTWIEEVPRTSRAVLRAYREAGAGLAAAHRAGFVHRDFKPDNALIGTDDRVRVVDFGLVHVEDGTATLAGLGTPRYMAPEQAEGGAVTAAADQYAFCASLREALRARKEATGSRAEVVPRWLDEILERGLSRRPEQRYPSMDALLDALARDPASRWRIGGAIAGIAVIGATAFAIGRVHSAAPPSCDGGRAELDAVWGAPIRAEVVARLEGLATPYSRQAGPRALDAVDRYAAAWTAGHRDACRIHQRGAQSDALFDRRMRCLDRARAALAAAVSVLHEVTPGRLAPAVTATGELPLLARCADPALLPESVVPPRPHEEAEVNALERELAAREIDVRAAASVIPAIDELVARARVLGYRPALARALRLRGFAAIAAQLRDDAVAPLAEATTLALAVGDDELAVEAFARRAWAEGTRRDAQHALEGLPLVEAIASRLPAAARHTRALLANNVGGVELAIGRRERARSWFERALAEAGEVTGPAAIELAQIRSNLALAIDDPARRTALFAETIALLTAAVGASHPRTLDARIIAAMRTDDRHAAEQGLASACAEYTALHRDHGASIMECAFELGWLALDRGDDTAARRWFDEAVAAEASGGTPEDGGLARAHLRRLDGDPAGAATAFAVGRAALGELDRQPWWRRRFAIEADAGHGLAARDAGDRATAQRMFARARTQLEAILADHPSPARARRLERVKRELARLAP